MKTPKKMFDSRMCPTGRMLLMGVSSALSVGACGTAPDASELDAEGAAGIETSALCQGKPRNITVPSDTHWNTYSSAADGSLALGKAQQVCLNATSPVTCPAGATDYGYPATGWGAHIDACSGNALWIWAPGVTGGSGSADLAEYSFQKQLKVPGKPAVALVHLSADDFAELRVNGTIAGSVGSITDSSVSAASQSAPTEIDIASALVPGLNTITIRAVNGPGEFGGCSDCTYQQNPAAVTFCVDIRY